MAEADGSHPLENDRWEIFAQERARGKSQAESYAATVPFGTEWKGGNAALRVSGHRVEKRDEVKARIRFLAGEARRAMNNDLPETLTRGDIIAASLEVSEVLEAAYRACVSAEIAIPPTKLEALKSVWTAHLARQGKLEHREGEDAPKADSPELAAMLANMGRECTCQTS